MTTIEQIKLYFLGRCNEIISMSNAGDPWVFVCGAAMIDYLTQMTTAQSGRVAYINFVDDYFKEINLMYKEFEYTNGQRDLPTQMYIILRCGIVHKFSFVPGSNEIANGGRMRSIILAHEKNGHTGAHLTSYTKDGMDGAVFTAEQFAKDIKAVVEFIFTKASTDPTLKGNIQTYITNFPPIQGKFN
jgi:hypothetical protein